MKRTLTQIAERLASRTVSGRTAALVAAACLVTGAVGTAAALSVTSGGTEYLSLFSGSTAASNFAIEELDSKVKGMDRVDISITLTNTDTANAHSANATVQLLNGSGTLLLEQTQDTGSVAADTDWSHTYSFSQTDLASSYESSLVVVEDSS